MRRPGPVLVPLAVMAFAVACSPQLAPDREAMPDELHALNARVVECRADFERGIELVLAGENVLGRNVLEAATNRMAALAEECSRTPGCDTGLFDRSLGRVFRERINGSTGSPSSKRPLTTAGLPPGDDGDSPIVNAIPEIGRTVALLHGTDLQELIELNAPVKAAMYDWLTWERPALMDAYENYRYMRRQVAPIYEEAGLPEALLFAMMATETGAKVHAYSRKGAAGPLQFMTHTARRYGLDYVDGFDERYDPVAATRANVAYINDQFGALNNDLETVLAAYNAGESRVRALHRKLDGADFWDPRMYQSLPRETRDYVPQVLAAAWLFLHPDEYDLEFPRFENDSTRIKLTGDIALGELAICLGQADYPKGWYRTLRNLNPRLSGTKRAPLGTTVEMPSRLVPVYARRCVDGAPMLTLARDLHDANFPSQ
jgi:membrane-bound lytic murein transglycosylase D